MALLTVNMREKGVLLSFVVFVSSYRLATAIGFLHSLTSSADSLTFVDKALSGLVSGPLRDRDLVLVTDPHSTRLLDINRVLAVAGTSITPILLASQDSMLSHPRPAHQTKGTLLTALLLFHRDPTPFLDRLKYNMYWNPGYLVLICLNPDLNTTSILSESVVQRAKFISLLQPGGRGDRKQLYAYTSLPMLRTPQNNSLIKAPLGTWSADRFHSQQALFPPRFKDFGGYAIQLVLICYGEPYQYYDANGKCIGINPDTLSLLAEKLNLSFELIEPTDMNWGNKVNGTWDGMLGFLMTQGSGLVQPMTANPDRNDDFDSTYPYIEEHFSFLLSIPPPAPQWKNILYPFSTVMWGLLIVTTLSMSIIVACLFRRLLHIKDPVELAFMIAGGIVNQPMQDGEVRAWWARVWLVSWWIAVDVLAAAYMSNLIAVLTLPVYPARVNTLHDLANSHYIPCMLNYGSFVPNALRTSDNPILAKMGQELILDHNVIPNDPYRWLLNLVLANTHFLIITIDYLRYTRTIYNITESTYIMREMIYSSYLSWILPLNTPYTETISYYTIRLLETGITTKIYQQHLQDILGRETQVHSDGVLNIGHLQGAFIVLGVGLTAAAVSLLLERITKGRS